MSDMPLLPKIRSNVFIEAREKLGLSAKELAHLACISTRQVLQIENGETDSFYSPRIKVNAAKKVAVILNLNEIECFEVSENIAGEDLVVKNKPASKAHSQVIPAELNTETAVNLNQYVRKHEFSQLNLSPVKPRSATQIFFWFLVILVLVIYCIIYLNFDFYNDAKKVEEGAFSPNAALVTESANDQGSGLEKPAEQINSPGSHPNDVAELKSIATPSTPPEVNTSSSATGGVVSESSCPSPDASMATFKPSIANKSGDMVYLQSKIQQVVCVIDATGHLQGKPLDAGAGVSFYGRAPFKVLTASLDQTEIFFQGQRVRPSNPNGKSVLLEQAD